MNSQTRHVKSSKKLTKSDIAHVADLIKIYLADHELEKYRDQLEEALSYAEVFDELDTKNVDITSSSIGIKNVYREDEPSASLDQEDALQNASEAKDGYIVVKRVIRKN